MVTRDDLRARVQALVDATPEADLPALQTALACALGDTEARLRLALARRDAIESDAERLLTLKQAAALGAVSPSYLKRLAHEKRLPVVKLPATTAGTEVRRERAPKAVRIRRSDLLRVLAGERQAGA
jgi:hypothetical protein